MKTIETIKQEIARLESEIAKATKANKADEAAQLTVELDKVKAELKAAELDVYHDLKVALDGVNLDAASSKVIYDLFEPHFKPGVIIALVVGNSDGSGQTDRSGEQTLFLNKLMVANCSKHNVDVTGRCRKVVQTYWAESFDTALPIGDVIAINAKKFAVEPSHYIYKGVEGERNATSFYFKPLRRFVTNEGAVKQNYQLTLLDIQGNDVRLFNRIVTAQTASSND